MPVIEADHVSRRYGAKLAVNDVTMAFQSGECTAIVGHNGAGKSTLIKMLLGLVRPTSGRISILGEDPTAGGRAWRSQVGFLPESVSFPPNLSGRETLGFYARLKRHSAAPNAQLLERVGLTEAADRRVSTYSKGMRQRLGLAQALLGSPRVLVLDEPTNGLDPTSRQSFYGIIRGLVTDGVAVLLSSHALEEIEGHADRIAVMSDGRLRAFGTLDELRGLSELPVQIQLRVADGAEALALVGSFGMPAAIRGCHIDLACPATAKMDVLRRVVACDEVVDFDVLPPTLDSLYAWFMEVRR
jgi:Cu-processing system ATP-binding protein